MQNERTFTRGLDILEGVQAITQITQRTEVRSMDQLILGFAALVEGCREDFHPQVFQTFQTLIAGWIVCVGPLHHQRGLAGHRVSRPAVITTPPTRSFTPPSGNGTIRDHCSDHLDPHASGSRRRGLDGGRRHSVPQTRSWASPSAAFSSTPCCRRGRTRPFASASTWVVLGIAVPIPMRPDRYYCLPVLWRLCRKKGQDGYQTRPQAPRGVGSGSWPRPIQGGRFGWSATVPT